MEKMGEKIQINTATDLCKVIVQICSFVMQQIECSGNKEYVIDYLENDDLTQIIDYVDFTQYSNFICAELREYKNIKSVEQIMDRIIINTI